jgi:hypothetical protein
MNGFQMMILMPMSYLSKKGKATGGPGIKNVIFIFGVAKEAIQLGARRCMDIFTCSSQALSFV